MSLHHHKIIRKLDSELPVSGSITESNPTPTASILVQNSQAVSNPGSTPSGIPLVASPLSHLTTTAQLSTPTTTASSTPSDNQISMGTVIGACVAAVTALVFAVLLAVYCSRRQKQACVYSKSRNVARNVSRRRSHLGPWKRMDDDADRCEGHVQVMKQRPPSATLGTMFQRTLSNLSAEKSSETHNRESVGTMQHFAKYHPGLAAEMASQSAISGADGKVAKPPPVLHLMGRSADTAAPLSWEGDTVGAESFMSLHSSWSNSTSPMMMANAKSTPPATTSSLHHWERAEVVHVGSEVSEDVELQNPFADSRTSSSTARSNTRGRNPFFSGREHPVRRTLLPDMQKNPFADPDTPRDSSDAIQSLIAALEQPSSERIVSVQSSLYSRTTADDGGSTISVTAFPYPPTQINLR